MRGTDAFDTGQITDQEAGNFDRQSHNNETAVQPMKGSWT